MDKAKIILVDDEPDILRALEFRLRAAGYDLDTARDGQEAWTKIRKRRHDLVLADFMMPEMNGIELTRLVKSDPDLIKTQVLLFSCNTSPEFRKAAFDLGAVDYLPKTIGANAILERVHDLIRRRKAEEIGPAADWDRPRVELMPQLAALSRSLEDMLRLAKAGGGMSENAEFAVDAARRIAADISRFTDLAQKSEVSG